MHFSSILSVLRKNLVIAVSSLAIAGCITAYFVNSGKLVALESEHSMLDARLSIVLRDQMNGKNLDEDIAKSEKLIEEVESRLFNPESLATNYDYFFDIESESNVALSGVKQVERAAPVKRPGGKDTKNPLSSLKKYEPIHYEMTVKGTFANIVAFQRRLEGGSSLYRLQECTLSKNREDADNLSLRLILAILGRKKA